MTLLHLANWFISIIARSILQPRLLRLQQQEDFFNSLAKSMIAYLLFPFFLGIALFAFPLIVLPDIKYASSVNTFFSALLMIAAFLVFIVTAFAALYSLSSMLHHPWSLGNKFLRKSIRLSGFTRYFYTAAGFLIAVSIILTAFKDAGIQWFLYHTAGLTNNSFALPDLLQLMPALILTVLIIGVFILLIKELRAQKGPPAKCPVCDGHMYKTLLGKMVCKNCFLRILSGEK
jgi:hypothetical protein